MQKPLQESENVAKNEHMTEIASSEFKLTSPQRSRIISTVDLELMISTTCSNKTDETT